MVHRITGMVLAAFLVTVSASDNSTTIATDKSKTGVEAQDPNIKAEDIARTFSITSDSVDRLKETYSIGYGGISKALALAQKSGLSVDAILQMKTRDNLGWGEIARKLNLEPGKDYRLESAQQTQKTERKLAIAEKRAEHRAEKMEKKMDKNKGTGRN